MDQEIRFCTTSDGVRIAYATRGSGPVLVKAANWLSHLEFDVETPVWRHWIEELSHGRRLVRYDERGCGLSDWDVQDFGVEPWVRDLEAVVEATGLERFPLLGISQGGPVAMTYAVRHPGRVSRLILYGSYARGWRHRSSPEEIEESETLIKLSGLGWGRDSPAYRHIFSEAFSPGASPEHLASFDELQRVSTSAANAVRFMEAFGRIEVSDVLSSLDLPTLVIHARGDQRVPFEEGRRLAAVIRGARFVALDTPNHLMLAQEPAWAAFMREVNRFLAEEPGAPVVPARPRPQPGALRTILFTDLEGHTAMMSRLGDARGRELLREHERLTRAALAAHDGTEVKTMGDGFLASFGSAQQALECAIALQRTIAQSPVLGREPGLKVRCGVNAGEPIAEDDDLFGATVNAAARIAGQARGGEVLVADVVRQLVAGKEFLFADRGEALLRGFEDPVRLWELRWGEE